MAKPLPYRRSLDGRDYVCARDDAILPDGVIVQGHYSGSTLDGVRAIVVGARSADQKQPAIVVVHQCGTITGLSGKWSGQSDQTMTGV